MNGCMEYRNIDADRGDRLPSWIALDEMYEFQMSVLLVTSISSFRKFYRITDSGLFF